MNLVGKDVLSMMIAYFVMFIPQCNLFNKTYDQHVGNMTVARISGRTYGECVRFYPFMAVSMVIFSAMYDLFRERMPLYKIAHAMLSSALAPFLYIFVLILTGKQDVALYAALFYGCFFHMPVTLNFLVQPEHYELLFFLSGGSAVLLGLKTGALLPVALGAFLLGVSALCKVPGLISAWFVLYSVYAYHAA